MVVAAREAVALEGTILGQLPVIVTGLLAGAGIWAATVLADIVPRSLAAAAPEAWALPTAPVLPALRGISPFTRTMGLLVEALVLTHSRDVNAPEPALVRSLFEFGEHTAKDVMVPRTDVVAIRDDADPRTVVQMLVEEGHTRVPVYRGTLDKIIGIVHVKDLLPLLANPELLILHDLLRPALFVPWNRPIAKVMREMQRKHQHFAVVVDEYGGVAGIITLEDIVEQIVGEIRDEFDEDAGDVVQMPDGGALVQADMRTSEFNRAFGAQVPEDAGYETMGGFLSSLAGAIPSEGDRFYQGGFEFLVTRRDPRRVLELRATRTRTQSEGPAAPAP